MPLLAGQGVGLVGAVKGAASVIADLTAQALDSLSRYPAGAGQRSST
jgi:enoyl-[acyl-carrier protein] reductase II